MKNKPINVKMFEIDINQIINEKLLPRAIDKKYELLIDDIIDIYNHEYPNYEHYFKMKQILMSKINELNTKSNDNSNYNYYITPTIIGEITFNYIFNKNKRE